MSTLAEMTSCELISETGKKRTASLPSSQSYSSRLPAANVVAENPSSTPLCLLVTLPARCRRMRPVVNISEWTP